MRKKKRILFGAICALLLSLFLIAGCEFNGNFGFNDGEKPKPSDTVYVIQYHDGESLQRIEVKNGDVYAMEKVPQKTGYDFLGLYDAEEGGVQYVNSLGSCVQPFADNRNLVLYPRYSAKEYTFLLDYGAADSPSFTSLKTVYGAAVNGLPLAVRAEYKEFKGWYTAPDCGGKQITDDSGVIFGNDKVTEEVFDLSDKDGYIRLYAGFEDVYYTVNFYCGDRILHTAELLGGSELLKEAPAQTEDGGVISDWSYVRNGTPIAKEEKVQGTANVYARSVHYSVTFDCDGGSELAVMDGIAGKILELPEPVKENYEFLGWEQDGEFVGMKLNMPYANVALKATWRKVGYVVTYLRYEGDEEAQTRSVRYEAEVPLIEATREHYEFAGWTYEGETVEKLTMPEKDITLIAQWTQVEFAVRYCERGVATPVEIRYYAPGKSVELPSKRKEYHDFLGWEYASELVTEDFAMPEKDIVFYARWQKTHYRVTFDSNGGTSVSPWMQRVGSLVTLPNSTKEYYTLSGWRYQGQTVTAFTMPEGDVTVVAQWEQTYKDYKYIFNTKDFLSIAQNPSGKYMLLNNLDLSEAGWTPLGQFYGTFNGMGHTIELSDRIHTFSIQSTDTMYLGWFCCTNSGTLTDFSVKNLIFRSTQNYHLGTYTVYMGGIVGFNTDSGSISNVKLVNTTLGDASAGTAQIICDRNNSACGGIAGVNHGTLSGCSVSARIYGTGDTGGVCGVSGGTITGCSFTGKIGFYMTFNNGSVWNRSWGGIVGYCNANAKVTSCKVSSATFEYRGEESGLHHKNIFGTHVNCDLQPHVGIICGSAAKSNSFSGNSHSSTAKSLQIKGGNFHNGDREKAYLFKQLDGMVGSIA